ncbi:MAG: glutathione S-transferase family protein [Gammaproteobacteria bacterium]|nr:glutathione S-transferase family protein [Gammaproteobacteria bacterium]
MYTIYGYSTFNPLKVVITAEELGIDYRYQFVDLAKRENFAPEHKLRHPFGKVPVLEHNGDFIYESAAICRYLANTNGKKLYSADPLQAARIDALMDVMSIHIGRWLSVYFWEELIAPKFLDRVANPDALEEAKGWLDKQLPYLDDLVSKQPWLCGTDMSIADCFTFAYLTISDDTSISLDPYANLYKWYQTMRARPAVGRAMQRVFASP